MSSLIAATRPIRRDMFKAPWRLLAAVLLVALPVGLVTMMFLESESQQQLIPGSSSRTTLTIEGSSCEQDAWGWEFHCSHAAPRGKPLEYLNATVNEALPAGMTAVPSTKYEVTLSNGAQARNATTYQLPASEFTRGKVPGPGEIFLPTWLARDLNVEVGDIITASLGQRTVDLKFASVTPNSWSYVSGQSLEPLRTNEKSAAIKDSWYLHSAEPVTWAHVKEMNTHGIVVNSPDVHNNLPPREELYPRYAGTETHDGQAYPKEDRKSAFLESAFFLSIYATVLVLVMLFISPVFSLAFTRHTRMFALMASQGAARWHIAAAVLSYALFAGLIGATTGVVGGLAVGWILWSIQFPGWLVSLPWTAMVVTWCFAVVCSVVAAALPAWMTSRQALSTGIAGAAPDRMVRWKKWMAVGPCMLVLLGLYAIITSQFRKTAPPELLPSPVTFFLAVLAVAASAPALIFSVARLSSRGPLAVRLAGRGILRQSLRTVPITAAVLALIFATAAVTGSSHTDQRRDEHLSTLIHPHEIALIQGENLTFTTPESTEPGVQALRENATVLSTTGLYGTFNPWIASDDPNSTPEQGFSNVELSETATCSVKEDGTWRTHDGRDPKKDPDASQECLAMMTQDKAYSPLELAGVSAYVITPEQLSLWSFDSPEDRAAAERILTTTGVIVSKADGHFPEGKGHIGIGKSSEDAEKAWHEVPIAAALPAQASGYLMNKHTAKELGLHPKFIGTAVEITSYPSSAARQKVAAAIKESGMDVWVRYTTVEREPVWPLVGVMSLVVFIAMALVIALGARGLRRDNVAYQAIGADAGLMAKVAAYQTGLLTFSSMLGGTVLAMLANACTMTFSRHALTGEVLYTGTAAFIRPEWPFVIASFAVPLVTATVAWFIHRPSSSHPAEFVREHGSSRMLS